MNTPVKAFCGADIFDGSKIQSGKALIQLSDQTATVLQTSAVPQNIPVHTFTGGTIVPGFVDLQVNGGGGLLFNDDQSVETLQTIAEAHDRIGTTQLLPTLITDTAARTQAAINAVDQAICERIKGIVGIHLEGPHLSVARKGAHEASLIRQMDAPDLRVILHAAERLPNVMLTVAPENVTAEQIKTLSDAGVVVSLGHTNAGYDMCMAAFEAGARCATHLFNAMSQLGSRDPGLVGAVLSHGGIYAGLIADGIHVHPATIQTALAAKAGPGQIFLVTDAMATAGSDITEFELNGRTIQRKNARLTLSDGTLAGADLEFSRAISVLVKDVGIPLEQAIRKATDIPRELLSNLGARDSMAKKFSTYFHLDSALEKVTKLAEHA